MSLSLYGRIQTNCVNVDIMKKAIVDFFSLSEDGLIISGEENVTFEGIDKENTLTVFWVKEEKLPCNVYASDITNSEFYYTQLVIFDIQKEKATIKMNKKIIDFFIYFAHKIRSDILVTSDVHNEICLIKSTEVIWSQNLSFNYEAICGNY